MSNKIKLRKPIYSCRVYLRIPTVTMRQTLLVTFCLFSFFFALGQRPSGRGGSQGRNQQALIKGKILGRLVDEATGDPVEFATVSVQNKKSQKTVSGGLTDEDGTFKITDIPVGEYQVMFSFVGYGRKDLQVVLTPKAPDFNMEQIQLTPTTTNLDELVVTGDRELIENRVDKIVYNSEQDVANLGGDATDVLRRTPLLSVDLEGNVSLRGSQNIQILINGKPSSILASTPGEALQAIPAEQIKAVEVITSPSAKYDGEGTAGIINIITKRKSPEGFAGSINTSVGTRSNRGNLSLTMGKGRFGLNANGSSYYSWPRNGTNSFVRIDQTSAGEASFTESGINRSDRLGFFGTAGAFYDFNAYHGLTSALRIRGRKSNSDGTFTNDLIDPLNDLSQSFERITVSDDLRSGFEWSLDYIAKFPDKKERELSVSYKLDGNISNEESLIGQSDLLSDDLSLFRDDTNINDGDNRENTLQVDFTDQFGSKVKFETGAKAILRHVVSDYSYDFYNVDTDQIERDPNRTDLFNYDQDVWAGYVSITTSWSDKLSSISGLRYEATEIDGRFDVFDSPFSNSYQNLLPSVSLNYKLEKFTSIKLSYNRRIQRPSLRFINPFRNQDNVQIIQEGNPELDPELTDNYEVGYNFNVKKVSVFTSFYVRKTTDVIESFVDASREDAISVTTYRNIGTRTNSGFNIFTNTTLFSIWTLRAGVDLFRYNASGTVGGEEISNEAILASGNVNSNVKLSGNWTIDVFGFFRGRRQTLQGFNPSFSIFGVGAQKKIWQEKGTIGIRIIEPFAENKIFESDISGTSFQQSSTRSIPFRSFGLTFSYKFGKLDFKQRQRRSKIRNDDQLSGDDNNNGF